MRDKISDADLYLWGEGTNSYAYLTLGCIMAHGESLEQACAVHGIDCDALVDTINQFLENK